MKKNFLRIAIMAVFALTLLAGSALADTVGQVAFHGNAQAIHNEAGTIIGFNLLPIDTVERNPALEMDVRSNLLRAGDGIFEGYFPNPSGEALPWNIYDYPKMANLMFRDKDGNRLCDDEGNCNIAMENPLGMPDLFRGGVSLGDTQEFYFYTEEFTSTIVELESLIGFRLAGYVIFDDPDVAHLYEAVYTISFINSDPGNPDAWDWTFDVVVTDDDTPPVPEPGTLVLLGTGILGAAIVARRKIKK